MQYGSKTRSNCQKILSFYPLKGPIDVLLLGRLRDFGMTINI